MPTSTPLSRLHVAIDCRVVSPRFPGIGRATLETVRALAAHEGGPRLSLLVDAREPQPALYDLAGMRVRLIPMATAMRSPADQWTLPLLLRRLRPDIYHSPYYAIPALLPGRVVLTVHDLIPRLFPAYWPNPAVRRLIDAWTSYALWRADRLVAVSETTARDVARLSPRVAGKVRVVRSGVSPRDAGVRHTEAVRTAADGAPYLLYVGSNKPHKNLPRLVDAFARLLRETETPGNLVIAGAWDPRYPEAADAVRRHGLARRVSFEHRPSDERLDALYAGARGFVFPSLYEGFGLPVLEAMAAGLPVATSARGSLAEVAGDAALLFDPEDEDAMRAALHRLLRDDALRAALAAAGLARARLFPWSRTAAETCAVYAELAAR